MLIWLPINIWAAAQPRLAWEAVAYLGLGIVLFGIVLRLPYFADAPQRVAWLLIGGITLLACIAPLFITFKDQLRLFEAPIYGWLDSLQAPLDESIHSNVLASALVQVIPVALAMAIAQGSALQRRFTVTATVVLLSMAILTQGRSALLGLSVAFVLMALLYRPRLFWIAPLLLLGAFSLIRYLGSERLLDAFTTGKGTFGGGAGRLDIWANSLLAIRDFMFTGIGIGTFTIVMPTLYPLRVNIADYPHAHNLFLQVALDLGLPGLIAYLAILINVFAMLIATTMQRDGSVRWALAVGLIGSMVALLIDGIFSTANWGTKLAFLPWLLFALAVLLYRQTPSVAVISGFADGFAPAPESTVSSPKTDTSEKQGR